MRELKVPYALDKLGHLYSPFEAKDGKRYFCPACKQPVILRKGQIEKRRFAHKPDVNCNQEKIIHQTAKHLIKKIVYEWKSETGKQPVIERFCEICGSPATQPLSEKVESVFFAYRLADGSIADVALLNKGKPIAAVKIKVTHEIDENKASRFSIPFIELEGPAVIENPYVWKPIEDNLKPFTCKKCRDAYRNFRIEANKIAEQTNIELPKRYYRYGIANCCRCNRRILIFTWDYDSLYPLEKPSGKPIPRTIKKRYSEEAKSKYWANTCPYCKELQGGVYLSIEPHGPFTETDLNTRPDLLRKTFKGSRLTQLITRLFSRKTRDH